MYLIVGLGNPGKKYEKTRHNVGFMTLDLISSQLNVPINKSKFQSLYQETRIGSEKVVLLLPQTFMNRSGLAVTQAASYYKVMPHQLIVIYDDIDLECGSLRIRKKGSAGTHNGMRDIIYRLGYDDFPRVRIGISNPQGSMDLADYVTGKFYPDQIKPMIDSLNRARDASIMMVEQGIDRAMNQYNG